MQTYAVQYRPFDEVAKAISEFFIVQAEDRDHAVEQCRNAYSDIWIIRVFIEDES